ncbi:hypothetical protein LSCM1_01795 [Leishmania martiniquensis]|uniref:Doublecortin domain-containing protein n=1 Tax=Leishmania martiniquensis TaxID=1580590 RepID=A0A836G9A5_9TRYP|nr:hypothetical protein LSCM1_01795 [Leishmania martiniquensis]
MDASASACCDGLITLPTAELRESLENILAAIGASERTCSEEGRALETQRQRVLLLLSKLDAVALSDTTDNREPLRRFLISPPCAETDDEGAGPLDVSAHSSEGTHARTPAFGDPRRAASAQACGVQRAFSSPPDHFCLLGNLFSQPRRRYTAVPSCTSSLCVPPSRLRSLVDEGGSDVRHDSDFDQCDALTVPPEKRHLHCSPEEEHSLFTSLGERAREWHNGPSIARRNRQANEVNPTRQLSSSRTPSAQACAQLSHRNSAATLPLSFWVNVWPCLGGTVASRARRPTRVLVQGRCRYFEDVLEKAAKLTGCQPAPHCFYTPDGCLVRDLEDLIAEHHYLLFPSGGFYRKETVPTALLWLLYKSARQLMWCS